MTKFVLVVDDDESIRETLCELLEDEGHRAVGASNGQEALDFLRSDGRPCMILLDIMMPVMDGWAFLEELQSIPATERPRVIVVSARSSLRDRAKAAELGADAFVAKPFSVDDLLVVLHDVERAV
jgi:CheY-like chemotaxis protein